MEKLLEEFSIGLFFWHSLIFLSLIFLLKKFAWKPILDTINEREEGIKDALESAEKAREEMQSLQADNEEIMKQARIERDSIFLNQVMFTLLFLEDMSFHLIILC